MMCRLENILLIRIVLFERDYLLELHQICWSGLQPTQAYTDLPVSDRRRIENTIKIEQFGVDVYGNPRPQKGTTLNCQ